MQKRSIERTMKGLVEAAERSGKIKGKIEMMNAYCPMCKTRYQPPDKCKCSHFIREQSIEEFPGITVGTTDKAGSAAVRRNEEEYRRIWNAAIEAAAVEAKRYLNSVGYEGINTEAAIRGLKK